MLPLVSLLTLAAVPHGDVLLRVQTPTADDAALIHDLGLDVWTEVPTGPWLDVRVRPGEQALLDLTGLPYAVRVPDLGPRVAAERSRLSGPVGHGGQPPADFNADYRPLASIHARLDELRDLRPDLAETFDVGVSLEGRPLRAIEIGAGDDDTPTILVDAGQHAREWIAIAATTCVVERIILDAEALGPLLDAVRVVFVPVVNPDGYVHTWEDDRFWRKNRRPPEGVDLNRNFSVAFGGPGASGNPAAGNFHGEGPFSEPESAAIRDLAEQLDPLLALVDVHAYGQLVLYPWGFQLAPAPDDAMLTDAAQAFSAGLGAPWDTDYVHIPGAELYPAAGNIMDWAYGDLGAFAFGLELRPGPDASAPEGFVLPPADIVPVCDELYQGLIGFAEHVIDTDPPGPGDDGGSGAGTTSTGEAPPVDPPAPADTSTGGPVGGTAGSSSGPDAIPPPAAGSTSTLPPLSGESSGGSSGAADASTEGCGCTTKTSTGSLAWCLPVLAFARRRRRCAQRRSSNS